MNTIPAHLPLSLDDEVELRYFEIGDRKAPIELSTEMTEEHYKQLTQFIKSSTVEEKVKVKAEDAIILCLDKSGSMSGGPYEALKEGAILVAE